MSKIRITGVPEHFNYPWQKLLENRSLKEKGIHIEWTEESRGSGKMLEQLDQGETDLAVVLTESFFKRFEQNEDIKIIGLYVKSPLIWGIHTSPATGFHDLTGVAQPNFLISRKGSGSELMANVLADHERWPKQALHFEIIDNLPGALNRMKSYNDELFLWEKFTTKPYVDSGQMQRIGEVASPWPCFVMVAKSQYIEKAHPEIKEILQSLYALCEELSRTEETPAEISERYELPLKDVEAWFAQTAWQTKNEFSRVKIQAAVDQMLHFGIIQQGPDLKKAFDERLCKLV
ncbi:type 2 periplasmic-binding domain-containing protein [Algoriphagus namhaensis]